MRHLEGLFFRSKRSHGARLGQDAVLVHSAGWQFHQGHHLIQWQSLDVDSGQVVDQPFLVEGKSTENNID